MTSTMTNPDVVVVGGGLAGIAAALDCADRGLATVLLERRRRLGGSTYSIARGPIRIDNGQHVFLRCCSAYRRLLRRMGAEREVEIQTRLDVPLLDWDASGGRLRRSGLPAPLHLGPTLRGLPGLSLAERGLLAAGMLALDRVDPAGPESDLQSFGGWLRRHHQTERLIARVWELLTVATLNLRADGASLAMAAMVFQTALLRDPAAGDIGWSRVPLGTLHGENAARTLAAAGVAVHTGVAVSGIAPAPPGLEVTTAGDRVCAPAVILALPPREALAAAPPGVLDPAAVARLGRSPIVNLHVVFDRPVCPHPVAVAVDGPIQWVFDRTVSSGLDHGQYLAISLSAADGLARRPLEDLRAIHLPALERLFPAACSARVVDFFVTRQPEATFRAAPGQAALRPRPRTAVSGLYLAGAWTDTGWPATMEGAVRSGVAAADHLCADLAGRREAVAA